LRLRNFLLVLVSCSCATAPPFQGPLPVRNQHPAQLTVLHMDPAGAEPVPAAEARVRVDTAYSSYYINGFGDGGSFVMDGELLRTGIKTGIGLGAGLGLHFELAVAHTWGGFLDSFLIDYHDWFGLPGGGRENAPNNRWLVEARRRGTLVYEMTDESLELLDLPVELRWAFLPITADRPYGLAVRVAVEFPTGDEDKGFGNGEIDTSIGLVGELRQDFVAVTAHAQHTFVGTPDLADRVGFNYEDVTSVGVGTEVWVTDELAFLAQTEYETSVLRNLGPTESDDPQWLLWVGARTLLSPRISLEAGFGEDLITNVSPDFTAYLAFRFEVGGPSR